MITLFVFSLTVSDRQVRTFLFWALLLAAIVTMVTFIVVSTADHEKLRTDMRTEDGRLDRKIDVASSLAGQTIRHLENDNKQLRGEVEELRRMVYGELAIDRTLNQFLIDSARSDG